MASASGFSDGIIRPSIITHLKSILDQYPDNGQILKELIQNAEDAGAQKVRFLLDMKQYEGDGLCVRELDQFQGPSLLVYNDAVFKEDDWRGIRMMSDSVKRGHPMKVGRFGLGFKSVFHLTDLPVILSGDTLGFIDPHEAYFERKVHGTKRRKSEKTSSFSISLKDRDRLEELKHQLEPFCQPLFDLEWSDLLENGYFPGTIMRFPLRNEKMTSDLSDTNYTEEKVLALFKSFQHECHLNLIFLKNLEQIQVFISQKSILPEQLFEVSASGQETIGYFRREFIQTMNHAIETESKDSSAVYHTTYIITITTQDYKTKHNMTSQQSFYVCQYFNSLYLSKTNKGYVPWVGVAIPSDLDVPLAEGRIFCFLPLPAQQKGPTGLNFHVNGFFAVDQNRQHLKMPSSDQTNGDQDNDICWNEILVTQMVPRAVVQLAMELTKGERNIRSEKAWQLVQRLIPDRRQVLPYWEPLVTSVCKLIDKHCIFWTTLDGGTWIEWTKAFFWNAARVPIVEDVLLKDHQPLVHDHSDHIVRSMTESRCTKPIYVSPRQVVEALGRVQTSMELNSMQRNELLTFIIGTKELQGLELLPLQNGSFTAFDNNGEEIFVDDTNIREKLLRNLPNKFVLLDEMTQASKTKIQELAFAGQFQLQQYLPEKFPSLLKTMILNEKPNLLDNSGLDLRWLEQVWQYIQHNAIMLETLCDLPLVPASSKVWLEINKDDPIIVGHCHGCLPLHPSIVDILEHLNIRVVDQIPQYIMNCTQTFSEGFLHKPDARGILHCISTVIGRTSNKLLEAISKLSETHMSFLRKYLSEHCSELSEFVSVISSFPILPLVGSKGRIFASADELLVATNGSKLHYPLEKKLIDSMDNATERLLDFLGVESLDRPSVLMYSVVPTLVKNPSFYSCGHLDMIERDILNAAAEAEDPDFIAMLMDIAFLTTKADKRAMTSELFNPHEDKLLNSLLPSEKIPSDYACQKQFGPALAKLGMKTSKDLSHSDYLNMARMVGTDDGGRKANNFAKLMEKKNFLFSDTKFCEEMSQIPWVPVVISRSMIKYPDDIPFFGESNEIGVDCPRNIVSDDHAFVVGAVKSLVQEKTYPNLSDIYGWGSAPLTKHLLEQLQIIATKANTFQQHHSAIVGIYSLLKERKSHEIGQTLSALDFSEWLYHGQGFCDSKRLVSENILISLEPYAFKLPTEMKPFRDLFYSLGAPKETDLGIVLCEIAEYYSANESFDTERLQHDFQMVLEILRFMSTSQDLAKETLLVPVQTEYGSLKLVEKSACTLQEDNNLELMSILDDEDINFVHSEVSHSVLAWLKIPSLASRVLQTEDLDMSYGQEEPLTRRLKNLLKDYSDGLSIMKELIQNADDAGASEIKFLFDERTNQDSLDNLFDRGMQAVHGPALWAYNDACFTEDDFVNIVKLSGATKEMQKDKIGQFGLGFNTVYNMTDVPSLVSGSQIVFFDPHLTHLGRVVTNKAKPGIKIDITKNQKTLQHFKNQFAPFNGIYGCNLSAASNDRFYMGTLFRFPLRTVSEAYKSDISEKPYLKQDVIDLMNILRESHDTLLLFTQNVKRIVVDHLPSHEVNPLNSSTWFSIEKQNIEQGFIDTCRNENALQKAADMIKSGSSVHSAQTCILQVCIRDTDQCQPELKQLANNTSHWYVNSVVGDGPSRERALAGTSLLPVAGVAARLIKNNEHFRPQKLHGEALVFCFLPLPQKTSLPVHINGCFAVSSSRRHLCTGDIHDKLDKGATWNRILVEDALADAYVKFLVHMVSLMDPADCRVIFDMWPQPHDTEHNECPITRWLLPAFVRRVCQERIQIFPATSTWISFLDMVTLDRQDVADLCPNITTSMLRVFSTIFNRSFVDLPLRVQYAVRNHCRTWAQHFYSKERFYEEVFLSNIASVTISDRDELLISCLSNPNDANIHFLFIDKQCIPVLPDGTRLVMPKSLVDPRGHASILYEDCDCVFPSLQCDDTNQKNRLLDVLCGIGMTKDELTWEQIIDRCGCIKLRNKVEQITLAKKLIKLMNQNIKKDIKPDDGLKHRLQTTRFLPLLPQSDSLANIPWKGNDHDELLAANELFRADQRYLVCCIKPIVHLDLFPKQTENHAFQLLGFSDQQVLPQDALDQLLSLQNVEVTSSSRSSITSICYEVYRFFQKMQANNTLPGGIIRTLQQTACILHESQFVHPDKCTLEMAGNRELRPFLFCVDLNISIFRNFLKSIGVKECFSAVDFLKVLQEIKNAYRNEMLPPEISKVAINIVQRLTEKVPSQKYERKLFLNDHGPIYLPNAAGSMTESTKLCYKNCLWLNVEDEIVIHPNIALNQADKLGVKTIKQEVLRECMIGMPFGQNERLVNRINRILYGYPFDESIMKELLQNADDAGATEIHFILDTREHSSERLFDDSWKSLQGPALCVYNNRPFSKSDIKGISRLGEGAKIDNPCKTGQFGVGFNCVYHVTDTPTFLTTVAGEEKTLVAFDPNCSFVPGASVENPGMMYKITGTLEQQFSDVVGPYMQDKYDLKNGTMFRFPLRSPSQEKSTGMTNAFSVSIERIQKLLGCFNEELADALLFLKHISKVVLLEVDKDGDLKCLHSVQCCINDEDNALRQEYNQTVASCASEWKSGHLTLADIKPIQIKYNLTVSSDSIEKRWIIAQQFGFESPNDVTEDFLDGCLREKLALLPQAGVAFPSDNDKRTKSKLFCLLPLPVHISLPTHVNGHFTLDHENRRDLYRIKQHDVLAKWNDHIMTHVVVPAYAALMVHARTHVKSSDQNSIQWYLNLFPVLPDTDDRMFSVCQCIYRFLHAHSVHVMPVVNRILPSVQWLAPSDPEGYFEIFDNICDAKVKIITNIVRVLGIKLFIAHKYTGPNFKSVMCDVQFLTPDNCLACCKKQKDFTGCYPKPLNQSFLKDADQALVFLEYCCRGNAYLSGAPLLVTADGMLRVFGMSPVYGHPYKKLLPKCTNLFVHENFQWLLSRNDHVEKFTIPQFANNITQVLPADVFHGHNMKVAIHQLDAYLPTYWLKDVWRFIADCIRESCSKEKLARHGKKKQGKLHLNQVYSQLSVLDEWCLLPARKGGKKIVLPVQKANSVLANSDAAWLFDTLTKCDLYMSDLPWTICYECHHDHLQDTLSCVARPRTIALAFCEVFDGTPRVLPQLSPKEMNDVLLYFSQHSSKLFSVPDVKKVLRSLPFYQNLAGRREHMLNAQVYVLPCDVPLDDMDTWQRPSNSGMVFLRDNERLKGLYTLIDCEFFTVVKIYCEFIFLQFEYMSENGRFKHLKYVMQQLLKLDEAQKTGQAEKLVDHLRALHCLPDRDGLLRPLSEFFDRTEDVFVAMEEQLVPIKFGGCDWLNFFRRCGMQHHITSDMLIAYVHRIANTTSPVCAKLVRQTRVLITHIEGREDLLSENILTPIKNVKFIPQHVTNRSRRTNSLIAFNGSCPESESQYIWTIRGVLPLWSLPSCGELTDRIRSELGIVNSPPPLEIYNHLLNICKMADVDLPSNSLLLDIAVRLAQSTDTRDLIRITKCVRFELEDGTTIFAMPSQTVMQINEDIQPYLFRAPKELWERETDLLDIGVSQTCTVTHYASALRMIYHHSKSCDIMGPNLQLAVMKCLRGLFRLCKDEQIITLDDLYLPAQIPDGNYGEYQMYVAKDIVYKDFDKWNSRITSLKKPYFVCDELDNISLYTMKRVFENMPNAVAPKLLSQVIDEVLVNESTGDAEPDNHYAEKMVCPTFHQAICSIVQYCKKRDESVSDIAKVIASIQVARQPQIKTHLRIERKQIPGSERHVPYFTSKDKGQTTILLQTNISGKEVVQSICDAILDLMQLANVQSNVTRAVEGIIESKESDIQMILEQNNIPFTGYNQKRFLPLIGAPVPEKLHGTLTKGHQKFAAWEYVALKCDDHEGRDGNDAEESCPKYVYGQIAPDDAGPKQGQHRVLVAPSEHRSVDSAMLYRFVLPNL